MCFHCRLLCPMSRGGGGSWRSTISLTPVLRSPGSEQFTSFPTCKPDQPSVAAAAAALLLPLAFPQAFTRLCELRGWRDRGPQNARAYRPQRAWTWHCLQPCWGTPFGQRREACCVQQISDWNRRAISDNMVGNSENCCEWSRHCIACKGMDRLDIQV